MTGRKVTTIPATINRFTAMPLNGIKKRRVAGYARVSTDHEDQLSSYEAQVEYYTNLIKNRGDWEFAGIYTDEGISATNTRKREGFNTMVADALAGKIDLIVTKSVSRFARNTVDSLTTVRTLKDKGIEIYFEKENIWTLDAKGELLITIMSSLAQEESRSISENVTWGHRKRVADGKVSFAYTRFCGLDIDKETGKVVVNKEQAKTVRLIYALFLKGMAPPSIAKELTRRGIKTPSGKDKWPRSTVLSMLKNEKYKGDALLQKTFTVDFLQKRTKKNEGEVPQCYVEKNHEAIISPEVFDMVQAEFEKRKRNNKHYRGLNIFSNKIKCADCGGWYGSKVWHSTDKSRKIVYRCNDKYKGEEKCKTVYVIEADVKAAFVSAFNQLMTGKEEILANAELISKTVCSTEALKEEKFRLASELSVLTGMKQKLVAANARVAQNQEEYEKHYNELVKRHDALMEQYNKVIADIAEKGRRKAVLANFVSALKKQKGIIDIFDEDLWCSLVDFVTVGRKKEIKVTFRDGTEIMA